MKAGDSVTKGQVLAAVDSPALTNRLQQEQAELERLKGVLEEKVGCQKAKPDPQSHFRAGKSGAFSSTARRPPSTALHCQKPHQSNRLRGSTG